MDDVRSPVVKFFKKYQERHKDRYETPLAISFLVTNRCILKCKHCFYHQTVNHNIKEEMSLDDYRRISHSLDDFFFALFCGGEPFLRDDFHEIVNIFRKNNKLKWTGTATNGQLTDKILKHTEEILRPNLKQPYFLTFSIEGFKDIHDFIRGEGTFDRALRSWRECKKLAMHYPNLKLSISTVINTINQHILKDFFRWAIKVLQPDGINFLLVRQSPRAGEAIKAVDSEKYQEIRISIREAWRQGLLGDVNNPMSEFMIVINEQVEKTLHTGQRAFHCYAGIHGAFIDYNGQVNVCEVFPDRAAACDHPVTIANLKDYDMDFIALWNSEQANRVRNLVNNHQACIRCTHETEGYLPSILFSPNRLDYLLRDL